MDAGAVPASSSILLKSTHSGRFYLANHSHAALFTAGSLYNNHQPQIDVDEA